MSNYLNKSLSMKWILLYYYYSHLNKLLLFSLLVFYLSDNSSMFSCGRLLPQLPWNNTGHGRIQVHLIHTHDTCTSHIHIIRLYRYMYIKCPWYMYIAYTYHMYMYNQCIYSLSRLFNFATFKQRSFNYDRKIPAQSSAKFLFSSFKMKKFLISFRAWISNILWWSAATW